ncbi:histone deacetylase [Streptomyces sp. NPDC051940]|uniref:histone deacetylase n=1 Tax=Streptomyces sp. NPDC051940 TaxID=3155675 RepID=UPI003432E635
MHAERLRCYLAGGRPTGAARSQPGCRDPRPPLRSVAVELPGTLYFAQESEVWGGGRAFYDPGGPGVVWARAHLLTVGQFSDIAAQEMGRAPGRDLDLTAVLAEGRAALGPGRYETLVRPGDLHGLPLLTFTAPFSQTEAELNAPSAAYLRHLADGLAETGVWEPDRIAAYLAGCPGAAGRWSAEAVAGLMGRVG